MLTSLEDLTKVRDLIMYEQMLIMLNHQLDTQRRNKGLMPALSVVAGEVLLDMVHKDFVALKSEFRQRNIKVWEEEANEDTLVYKYRIDGRIETFPIVREVLKAVISVKLGEYVKRLGDKMKGP